MTIPQPGFDPQPPPAPETMPSTEREVDAGLAQPFADGVPHEQVHVFEQVAGEPLTQADADALVGQPVEALDVAPQPDYGDLASPGIDYEPVEPLDADHESTHRPEPEPFVSQHRLRAERILGSRNMPGSNSVENSTEAILLGIAHALLAQVEVEEYKASFLVRY